MVRKFILMFCSGTFVLSTLQYGETFVMSQLNIADTVGENIFQKIEKVDFLSSVLNLTWAYSSSNLTKSMMLDAMVSEFLWLESF